MAVSGDDVYAGGFQQKEAAEWVAYYAKNEAWLPLGNGETTESRDSKVFAMAVSGNVVYAGGFCVITVNEDDITVAGYWKSEDGDMKWHRLGDRIKSSMVNSLVVSGTDVYAGGYCENMSGVEVAGYWKNGVWVDLGNGTDNSDFNSLVVLGTDVYAGGNVYNNITPGYWKNGVWTSLGNNKDNPHVSSLIVVP